MTKLLTEQFREPPKEFSPVPIWWWSGEPLVKERLRWQMERLAEAGVFQVLVLNLAPNGPLFGSEPDDPPFFSEAWWDCFLFVLQQAEQLGMRVWFYDQLGFSGARFQDQLVFAHPEFRGAAVRWLEMRARSGQTVTLTPPLNVIPLAIHALPVGDEAQSRCLAVFYEGTVLPFQWKAPAGSDWRLLLFYAVASKFDYLNPAACQALLDKVYGELERRAGKYFGSVLVGSFQDELPALPKWTWRFPDEFRRRKGYEIREWLPALFFSTIEEGKKVRSDAIEVLAAMAEEAFFRPLLEWHEQRGLLIACDQMCRNAAPIEGQHWYLDYFRLMRWFSAPGQDHSGDCKPHDAIAQLYGRRRVWLEGFHSSGWGHTLDELSQWLHRWYQRGANLYNPHAVYYSTKGSWWEWAPPSICWRQPYWQHFRLFATHIARLSFLLSQGHHVCPLAVLYPSTTIQAQMGLGSPDEAAKVCQQVYWALVGNPNWWQPQLGVLDQDYRDFTIVDEDGLQNAKVQKGALLVGNYRLRTIVLPAATVLRAKTFERLLSFAQSGGTVIAVGRVPELLLGKTSEETAALVRSLFGVSPSEQPNHRTEVTFPSGGSGVFVKEPEMVTEVLAAKLPRTVEGVPYRHWRIDREDFFFVVHPRVFTNPRPVEGVEIDPTQIVARFSVKGVPHLWDPLTGEVTPLPALVNEKGTEVRLNFSQATGLVLSFRRGKPATPSPAPTEKEVLQLTGTWDITYLPTLDNRWGDFDLPPSLTVPVQVRRFRFRSEGEHEDGLALGWHLPDFDDRSWSWSTYSFGTYLLRRGPFQTGNAPSPQVTGKEPEWQPVRVSLKLGIEADPLHRTTLGPKGVVPEEFVDLGLGKEGEQFDLFTKVVASQNRTLWLCVSGCCGKEIWLNGEQVLPETDADLVSVPVRLRAGQNPLLLRVRRRLERLRLLFQFLEEPQRKPTPQWIWFPELPYPDFATPQCWRAFRRNLIIPAPVQSAWLGIVAESGYRLWVNGHFLGEGRIDHTKVALQRYEIGSYLQPGQNTIAVRAWNDGGAAGLLIYGEVVLRNGGQLVFVSDPSWRVNAWESGQEPSDWMETHHDDRWWQRAMSQGEPPMAPWGEVSGLPQSQAPHPLPRAGWLKGQPERPFEPAFEPFPDQPKRTSWVRFVVPPGATKMQVRIRGQLRAFVDGREVFPDSEGAFLLPQPEKDQRIAALQFVSEIGYPDTAAILEPITFEVSKGRMGLGAWADYGLSCYAGGISCETTFYLDTAEGQWQLDLGKVRGTAEVWLNGEKVGIRVWAPFRFDLTGKVRVGENRLRVVIYSSLGPHYSQAIPTPYLFAEQHLAGLFGPVRLVRLLCE